MKTILSLWALTFLLSSHASTVGTAMYCVDDNDHLTVLEKYDIYTQDLMAPFDIQKIRAQIATDFVLKHEGLLNNSLYDSGGITKYGISLKFVEQINLDVNKDGQINSKDILALTINDARELYKTKFWDAYHYNEIHNLELAAKVFDFSVNMGAKEAHKLLQRAINQVLYYHHDSALSLKVDGILGQKTLKLLNTLNDDDILDFYIKNVVDYYNGLIKHNPDLRTFKRGWLCRAVDE